MEYGPLARWLVAVSLLGLAGLPIAARLFPRADGRGAGLALPVALAVLTLVAYYVGHLAYPLPAVAAGLLVLASLAALAGLDRDALRGGRLAVAPDLDVDRRRVAEVAAVFLAAYLFVLGLRVLDPAVHAIGGEKYLDFGLLQSLARADALPPEDVWFAGEPVSYYFGGHLASHLLATLAGTPPRFAYNLALPTFYAALVAGTYDLAGAVAASRGRSARLAGATAAFFVGVAANLSTAGRLLVGALPRPLGESVAAALGTSYDAATVTPDAFSYWTASRVIPGTVNEFPLFAYLNGDLHAHMTGTPFLLLGAALAFAYYRTPAGERRRRLALAFGALPAVAALGAVVNTWSFPTYFGLLWLAATFAPAGPAALLPPRATARVRALADRLPDGTRTAAVELRRPAAALVVAGLAGLVALVLAAPFLLGTVGTGREVGILAPTDRSALGLLLLVHGAFLAPFAAYLFRRLGGAGVGRILPLALGVAALGYVASAVSLPVAAVTVPLLVAGWAVLRVERRAGFEVVLVLAGAGLVTLVELVYVRELAGPLRFNTVFKTYAQVWVLWSVAAGVVLPAVVRRAPSFTEAGAAAEATERSRTAEATAADGGRDAGGAGVLSTVSPGALVLALLLVVATSSYGVLAVGQHLQYGREDPTTDALAFVDERHPESAAAVAWLRERDGQPTMVSAPATDWKAGAGRGYPPGTYAWGSSPGASLTGVPTVAGWDHEVGYRGREPYYRRVADVDAVYTGADATQADLLREYDVRYVWVGPTERDRYGRLTVTDLRGVDAVHRSGAVTVYEVDPSRLPE
jgi:YYY domain-containing protein